MYFHGFNGYRGCGFLGSTPVGGYIMMGLGLILIVAVVYLLFKKGNFVTGVDKESPLDVLKMKFINGDIDEAEYNRKKDILKK